MNPFTRLALAGPVAESLTRFAPNSPLLRTGIATVGMRYALRSLPVALAVVGAGVAWRLLRKDDSAKPVLQRRRAPTKPKPKAKTTPKSKAKPAAA